MVPLLPTTAHAPTIAPISTSETSNSSLELDQLVNVATTLSSEETPLSRVPTKRGRDDDQHPSGGGFHQTNSSF